MLARKWIQQDIIILSELSESQKDKCNIIFPFESPKLYIKLYLKSNLWRLYECRHKFVWETRGIWGTMVKKGMYVVAMEKNVLQNHYRTAWKCSVGLHENTVWDSVGQSILKFKKMSARIIQKNQCHNYNLYKTYTNNSIPNTKLPHGSECWVFNNHKTCPEDIPLHSRVTNHGARSPVFPVKHSLHRLFKSKLTRIHTWWCWCPRAAGTSVNHIRQLRPGE